MITSKLCRFGLGVLGVVALGAFTLPAAPAKADSFAFGYSSGGSRHYHGHRGYGHRGGYGYGARYVYVAPPPVYYYPPPPPRVVYVNPPPPPVYYGAPPPVAYQPPQALQGGPLPSSQPECREYQSTAVVNGRQVPTYGTACLQADGSWQIVR